MVTKSQYHFDKNYKLLDAAWDGISPTAEQVGATPVIAHDFMTREYTIKEEGYVFMYVSNENATLVDVYFDDIVMTHTKGNVVQYNEYYPFGLQTANSWTRENNTGNNFLANGSTELNTTSNLYDLQYRNYDPVLGRMNQVDPMATKYASLTPYNFSFNDPVFYNDVSGADPNDEALSQTKRLERAEQMAKNRQWAEGWRVNVRAMYGVVGDDDLFPKYGPGDGGSLRSLDAFMALGSHAAASRRDADPANAWRWALGIIRTGNGNIIAGWNRSINAAFVSKYELFRGPSNINPNSVSASLKNNGCPGGCPPKDGELLILIKSFKPSINPRVNVTFGYGLLPTRGRLVTVNGIGGDVGGDYLHGMLSIGTSSVNMQGTIGAVSFHGDYDGLMAGGDSYLLRGNLGYNGNAYDYFGGTAGFGTPIRSKGYINTDPPTLIDTGFFEIGYGSNYGIRDFANDLISGFRDYFNEKFKFAFPGNN